jgi:Zn finger protein HypA/HybF involved in hydrogenase expression
MRKLTTRDFIERSRNIHGDKYDYSLVEYKNNSTKVKIICPIHGPFEQSPNHHLRGQGCKQCGNISAHTKQRKSTEQFIIDAYCKHGDMYNYSLVDYKNRYTNIKIICHEHGVFEQQPNNHLSGNGCPKCGSIQSSIKQRFKNIDIINKCKTIHQNKYDYSLVKYDDIKSKAIIICPIHGPFEQRMDNHIYKQYGCPKCASHISRQEIELQDFIKSLDINVICNDRSLINPLELDIVIPSHRLAIEYNGLYWHSETMGKDKQYHLNKHLQCKENDYRLITIWENEWLLKQDIVKSFIKASLSLYDVSIGARQCVIKDVNASDARTFYDNNHLQGFQSGVHHGLYHNNELVSLMTIKKYKDGYMLERFVNKTHHKIYGSFSKLLKSFDLDGDVYTFADVRHFTGGVYEKTGFIKMYTTKPNYWYFKNSMINIYHRRHFQKKYIEKLYKQGELKYYNPDETEYINMVKNGYHRIWDCGNIKFVKRL